MAYLIYCTRKYKTSHTFCIFPYEQWETLTNSLTHEHNKSKASFHKPCSLPRVPSNCLEYYESLAFRHDTWDPTSLGPRLSTTYFDNDVSNYSVSLQTFAIRRLQDTRHMPTFYIPRTNKHIVAPLTLVTVRRMPTTPLQHHIRSTL
jgi:hypothetical protein